MGWFCLTQHICLCKRVHDHQRGCRPTTVSRGGTTIATFVYDGDGTRVQSTINGVTTKFVGEYYEVTGTTVTKYYGGSAMRVGGTLYYLLSDHLGSNSLILDTAGNVVGETRYTAWGEERYTSGTVSTDYTYTGQYSNTDDFGLMYYKARWYDPQLGRFAQADSIVPGAGNPISWDRYAYVKNNPLCFSDTTGHWPDWNWDNLNPLAYDTLTVGIIGLLKVIVGVDLDVAISVDIKAVKEAYSSGGIDSAFDALENNASLGLVSGNLTAGISAEADLGITISGSDDNPEAQTGTFITGTDGYPINLGVAIPPEGGFFVGLSPTFQPDSNNGYFSGVSYNFGYGTGFDLSLSLLSLTDKFVTMKKDQTKLNVPFFNQEFGQKFRSSTNKLTEGLRKLFQ